MNDNIKEDTVLKNGSKYIQMPMEYKNQKSIKEFIFYFM